jgi:hypothetical protein
MHRNTRPWAADLSNGFRLSPYSLLTAKTATAPRVSSLAIASARMNFKRILDPGVMIFPDRSLDQFKVIPSALTPDRKKKWITAFVSGCISVRRRVEISEPRDRSGVKLHPPSYDRTGTDNRSSVGSF